MALEEGNTPWFHFDPVLFLPLWIGIWRWAAYLILKGIPSLLYKPIPISEELEQGHVPVSTQMMTMIIPVYMPEPGFEECLQSWVDNRPKTIVIVVDTNSYQQVRKRGRARGGLWCFFLRREINLQFFGRERTCEHRRPVPSPFAQHPAARLSGAEPARCLEKHTSSTPWARVHSRGGGGFPRDARRLFLALRSVLVRLSNCHCWKA